MAMFQQYQSGIQPVTGMSEAGANIGNMYAQGLSNLGKGLAEGIKAYNENSAKNELANVKIQSLSQDVANKIAMYSQDPEIAQSGVLEGLMQTAATLQDAPTKGLSQRLGLVHDAEAKLAGFGQQLKEWEFLRGRQIERGISDALKKFAGTVTTTDSIDVNDPMFNVNPNETITQTKDRLFKILGEVKKLNPKAQINNDEFYARWLSKAEQEVAKAQDIDPRIISAQLEAINAEKGLMARRAEGFDLTDYESEVNDLQSVMQVPADVIAKAEREKKSADAIVAEDKAKTKVEETKKRIADIDKQIKGLDDVINSGETRTRSPLAKAVLGIESASRDAVDVANKQTIQNLAYLSKQFGEGKITKESVKEAYDILSGQGEGFTGAIYKLPATQAFTGTTTGLLANSPLLGFPSVVQSLTENEQRIIDTVISDAKQKRLESTETKRGTLGITVKKTAAEQKADLIQAKQTLETQLKTGTLVDSETGRKTQIATEQKKPTPVPTIGVGDVIVGSQETTRPLTVSEKKSQVQDFLTQRFGAIDPTDPTGKRRIPVQGFDQFFAKAVPESEVREFTTDSGIRLLQINGKWEQVKAPERPSIQDLRKERIGVFGQQTADGRLVPTEFVEGSGIYLGGLYRGTDAGADKFTDEITQLIDARRGVKRLQEINDKFGEAFSLKDSGEAAVEVMNLKAALRTDIIGVGTVSNFEQALIDKVIKDPTEFLSMEPRDRAILLALANRIDRRIKNISSSRGLTVQIRDTGSNASRYDDLRQRYLREKGLL